MRNSPVGFVDSIYEGSALIEPGPCGSTQVVLVTESGSRDVMKKSSAQDSVPGTQWVDGDGMECQTAWLHAKLGA
jgi:hypothetical protein